MKKVCVAFLILIIMMLFCFVSCSPASRSSITFIVDGKVYAQTKTGDSFVLPKNPTKDGYEFVGWFTDESLSSEWNNTKDTIAGTSTLFAKFVLSDSIENPATITHNDFVLKGIYTIIDEETEESSRIGWEIIAYVGEETEVIIPSEAIEGTHAIKIGNDAFYLLTQVKSVSIPTNIKAIGSQAFWGCSNVESIIFDEGSTLESIGEHAFRGCSSIKNILIPSSVISMGEGVFSECDNLVDVSFEDGTQISVIPKSAFFGCDNLSYVSIPSSVKSIDNNAFARCIQLTSINLQEGITSIGNYVFSECKAIETIDIPDSVEYIGDHAFDGCTSLKEVVFNAGSNLSVIGVMAFKDNSSLTSFTITSKVNAIASSAFINCFNLAEVWNYSSLNVRAKNSENGLVALYAKAVVDVPTGAIAVKDDLGFVCADISGNKKLIGYVGSAEEISIPSGVVEVGEQVFYNRDNLKKVVIPDSVTSIGNNAFYYCENLEEVTFGTDSQLNKIGASAFHNCVKLTTITIPKNVTYVDSYALYGCFRLVEICNKSSVSLETSNMVGTYALNIYSSDSGSKLSTDGNGNVIYTNGSEKIFVGNFSENTTLSIPSGVTMINGYALYNCTSLTEITIPDSVKSIGGFAFYNCKGLTNVVIPSSVTSIGKHALSGCVNIASLTIPFVGASLDGEFGTYMGHIFGASSSAKNKDCVPLALKEVAITGGKIIDSYAFYGCSGIEKITIASSVEWIGNYAFVGCTSLKALTFEDTSTWYYTSDPDEWVAKESGTAKDVSDSDNNATIFSGSSFGKYYWYRA